MLKKHLTKGLGLKEEHIYLADTLEAAEKTLKEHPNVGCLMINVAFTGTQTFNGERVSGLVAGLPFVRQVRQDPNTTDLPIISMTTPSSFYTQEIEQLRSTSTEFFDLAEYGAIINACKNSLPKDTTAN